MISLNLEFDNDLRNLSAATGKESSRSQAAEARLLDSACAGLMISTGLLLGAPTRAILDAMYDKVIIETWGVAVTKIFVVSIQNDPHRYTFLLSHLPEKCERGGNRVR